MRAELIGMVESVDRYESLGTARFVVRLAARTVNRTTEKGGAETSVAQSLYLTCKLSEVPACGNQVHVEVLA